MSSKSTPRFLGSLLAICVALSLIAWWAYRERRTEIAPTHPAPAAPNNPEGPDESEVERLRSLGYLDFVPSKKDDRRTGVIRNEAEAYPGYNFYTNAFLCSAVLVDDRGAVRNYWSQEKDCSRWAYSEFLESGDILVVGRDAAESGEEEDMESRRFLMKLSWDGSILWKHSVPSHHDVEVGPNGDLVALTTDHRQIREIDPQIPVRDNRISIFNAAGKEKESASLYDLFRDCGSGAAECGQTKLQRVRPKKSGEIDLFHANSVEWMRPQILAPGISGKLYSANHVLFCTRHQDTIGIVDWRKKRLVWAWGQGVLSGPHDATLLSNGHILVFDNGLARGWSRVLEVDPVRNEIVWQYQAPAKKDFYTASRGSNQRLPNGNTLIAESDKGRAFEVNPAGNIVWEFLNPFRNSKGERATIVRFYRIEPTVVTSIEAKRGEGRRKVDLSAAGSANRGQDSY